MKKLILISVLILGGLFVSSSITSHSKIVQIDEILTPEQIKDNEFIASQLLPVNMQQSRCYKMMCGSCYITYFVCTTNPGIICKYCKEPRASIIWYGWYCTQVSHCTRP